MESNTIYIDGIAVDAFSLNTVVVGTGAAGFNAADCLYTMGQRDIAIVTEGIRMGTSRNTGSDKQTYYKLTLAGDGNDSVMEMAKTYMSGGCMHGDIALAEAAMSAQCFFKLVSAGVPFPHNAYGEYVGYKTDHDPRQRATSAGPLTSKYMTEALETIVSNKNIKIFDNYMAVGILTNEDKTASVGLITLDLSKSDRPNKGLTLFNCTNIVYATGGPAGMYATSVYPESQWGASGIAFEAGVKGVNLMESQYGIASTKFRWNLSGTYQQVLPRYISTDAEGNDPREFLDEYFENAGQMLDAIFLKGYQWPFDPRKLENHGSSIIDLLVYHETNKKGRRVFLDYTKNTRAACDEKGHLKFNLLGKEAYDYLEKSGACFGTPIERLECMNPPAIELYKHNGIDLTKELLEIAVCAQHNNGGLLGDAWWESNLKHFFPVGEANGVFGVYRPGGSALNSTQVGSTRAAMYICRHYRKAPMDLENFSKKCQEDAKRILKIAQAFSDSATGESVKVLMEKVRKKMSDCAAHIRKPEDIRKQIQILKPMLGSVGERIGVDSPFQLREAFRLRDVLISQYVYLSAIEAYVGAGYTSRGSYMIMDRQGELPLDALGEEYRYRRPEDEGFDICLEIKFDYKTMDCTMEWVPVREIPVEEDEKQEGEIPPRSTWFENVWRWYREL